MNRQQLEQLARAAAAKYGVPVDWFFNLIAHESGWNPAALNASSGASGLGQFLPSTAAGYGVTTDQLRNDPALALEMSARLLSDNATVLGGDWAKAFAAYFVGVGNVQAAESQGGQAWLPALDNIASQYGQGTVTAYLSAVGAGGGGTATSSTAYPTSGVVGPNGRTVGQITGTDYLSPEERAFYLGQIGRLDMLSPEERVMAANMASGGSQMPQELDEFGFPVSTSGGAGNPFASLVNNIQSTVQGALNPQQAATTQGRINLPNGSYMEYVPALGKWAVYEPFVDAFGDIVPGQYTLASFQTAPPPGAQAGGVTEQQLISAGATLLGPGVYTLNNIEYKIGNDGNYTPTVGGAGGGPAGAVTREELIAAGADLSSPGIAILSNGAIYKLNPDGTYSVSATPDPAEDQAILSGAGLSRLFGNQPSGNLSQSLAAEGQATPQTAGAPGGATTASTNPMNRLFTQHQIAQAVSREGTEPGDVLGVAEPMFTGQPSPISITHGGIYEGGGLTPVRGALAAGVPEFSGYMPPTDAVPYRTSIGFGMARPMSADESMPRGPTFDPNYAAYSELPISSTTGGTTQVDARLNLMALRQLAADKGLIMPNLAAIRNEEKRGYAVPGAYKEALASLSKGIGTPLSALDLMAIQDPAPYRQNIQRGTKVGTRTYTPERYAELFPNGPRDFARGGSMTANRPMRIVDEGTGMPVATFAQNGPEQVSFGGEQGQQGNWANPTPSTDPQGRQPTRDQLLAEMQPDKYYYDPQAAPRYGMGDRGTGAGPDRRGYTPQQRAAGPFHGFEPTPQVVSPDPNYAPVPEPEGERPADWAIQTSQRQNQRRRERMGQAKYREEEQERNEEFWGNDSKTPISNPTLLKELSKGFRRRVNLAIPAAI